MVKKCLLGHAEIMGHRNFNKHTLLNFSTIPNSCYSIVICGDGSLPGASPLSILSRQWEGKSEFLLEPFGP